MHRIPGKEGSPRPVLIKFLRMDTKISLLRKKKAINEALKVRIGDDITKLNQGLLNRLYQHDNFISSWYFNGHVYGSDEEGTRHRSIIQFVLLVAGIEQNPGPDQSNKKNLKIVHNNVCSLLPKLDLINNELHEYDIICISESHLDKSITDDQIKLNGFHKPFRLDRNRHGGVRPNDKPFMNNLIRNKIRHRNRIHHKAKTSNNPDHWKKFKEIRNEIISLVRRQKMIISAKLTSQLIDKNIPPGKWWRIAKSIEQFRTTDGTFVISPDVELELLPNNVIDCLYHRITTTIQYFCAKRSRHGSIRNGWNICMDGCNTPNSKTVVHVLSTVDDYENVQSVNQVYKIKVHRHKPRLNQKKHVKFLGQTIKIDTWSDAVKHGSNGQDILIIDVDQLTERIVDHVINSGVLNVIQQLSIRISYGDPMSGIDYLAALKQLRKIIEAGFRIYWSRPEWSCIISGNKDRTSCVYIDMVYHKCRVSSSYDITDQHLNNLGHI
ncbi:Hypothetical predicted protein [Mytilus galloprovincialis]|uniref:Uncharacterized protein n=1 Tax=Mytilus galloprovincialis TaxID=29158 RepID=A0A8B6ERQ5_MYTGA|nr:Hypothetical predicted protein [Mytilus galloprovincialis]